MPRPYTPPVERLSISSHGLEYGFPSTHSTNAISISLYFAQLYLQNLRGNESVLLTSTVIGLCALYGVSVVAGSKWLGERGIRVLLTSGLIRLGIYCGMHSMTGRHHCASIKVFLS